MEEPSCSDALCRKSLKRRNGVTREDALLTKTPPDKDKPQKKAATVFCGLGRPAAVEGSVIALQMLHASRI